MYDYGHLFAIFRAFALSLIELCSKIVKALVYMDSSTYLDQMKVMVDN